MKRRDQALSLLAMAIGLFLWPILGWQFGVGIGMLGLAITHGILAFYEERTSNTFLKQTQDVILQVVRATTERETANIVRACLEHALKQQPPARDPNEKGH